MCYTSPVTYADWHIKSMYMQVGTIVWHVAAHEIGHAIYGQ